MQLPALPVLDCLPALLATLETRSNAVLIAPPGAGKTTLVPLALFDAPWRGVTGRIVMLEPRRLATRAAATRMASLLGEPVGGRIGYRTRLESAVSRDTLVEVVTEGLLVRRLQSDPGLDGVAAVIFDEVHERSLDADLALAFCLDLQRHLRPELRLIAMSATADGARLSTLMDAAVIESEGRIYPVDVRHAVRDIAMVRDLPDAMAKAVKGVMQEAAGDILAFLPGVGEIRRTEQALAGCGALVLPLYGDLPMAEQDRALRPAERPPRRAGHFHCRDVADSSWCAHRRRWRLQAFAPARCSQRSYTARDNAHQPCRRGSKGRPSGARGTWHGGAAMDPGPASRLGAVRQAGDPPGRAFRPGARLRRVGCGPCRSTVSRHTAGRAACRGSGAVAGAGCAGAQRDALPMPDGGWPSWERIPGSLP